MNPGMMFTEMDLDEASLCKPTLTDMLWNQ